MRPTKAKDLIPRAAEHMALPAADIAKVVDLFYQKVRYSASNLAYIKIHIPNLGELFIKHWLYDKYIQKYDGFEERTRMSGPVKEAIAKDYKEKLEMVMRSRKQFDEELQRKEFVKLHKRSGYESAKKTEEIKKELASDPGGILQRLPELPGSEEDPGNIQKEIKNL